MKKNEINIANIPIIIAAETLLDQKGLGKHSNTFFSAS